MATGTSFKQECPSCEAQVPVKDLSMVGKKIECPKCKDKFIVKSPEAKATTDSDAAMPVKAASKPAAKAVAGKKPATRAPAEEPDKNGKAAQTAKDTDGAVKKKAGTSRFALGIALAVVGVIVLGTAAFFILRGKGTTPTAAKGTKGARPAPAPLAKNEAKTTKAGNEVKVPLTETSITPKPVEVALVPANVAELSNLLPNDTQHVAHVPFRVVFDPAGSLADALFQTPGALKDEVLRTKLGFSLTSIDELLRAEHYGTDGWTFTVVHFQEVVNQDAVKKALDLKPAPLVKNHTHYQVSTYNPWLDQLARFAVGVPRSARLLSPSAKHPLYVHFHDPQTLIFADEAPMVALLKQDKHFKPAPDGAAGPIVAAAPTSASADGPKSAQLDAYSTIKPALKTMLLHMESVKAGSKSKVLFSSATDLDAARLPAAPPHLKGKGVWYPRQVWDVTLLLQDPNPRIRALGVAVVQNDERSFQLRNFLECPLDNDARDLQADLDEEIVPEMTHFIERLLGHKIALAKKAEVPDTANGKRPIRKGPIRFGPRYSKLPLKNKKDEVANTSKITVTQNDKNVELTLDLHLDQLEFGKLHALAGLMGCDLSAAMEVAARVWTRHDLARAGKLLPEKGLTGRDVLPGYYPPGAFPRSANSSQLSNRSPMQRISWMAGLLPYLNHESLYTKIHFNDSWRDPSNWGPAGTLVPQFIDPTYPAKSYYLSRSDLPFELAATHFVGIAGIGLDAADYDPADPAMLPKRGVMGYDKGMSLEQVRKGHGLGNTILMVQVPPDSIVGVTPWIAGGGSTLRGVPEKNSVAPFVFASTDKDGKARRGTYALMADGSVRYIDQSVSDGVFKSLATAQSPLPEGFDPDSVDSKTPLVAAPAAGNRPSPPPPVKKN